MSEEKSVNEIIAEWIQSLPKDEFIYYPRDKWRGLDTSLENLEYLKSKDAIDENEHKLAAVYVLSYYLNQLKPKESSEFNHNEFLIHKLQDFNVSEDVEKVIKWHWANKARLLRKSEMKGICAAQDAIVGVYCEKKIRTKLEIGARDSSMMRGENVDFILFSKVVLRMLTETNLHLERSEKKWGSRRSKNIDRLKNYIWQAENENLLESKKRAMTMFKTASRNQVDLVNILDKKAGIMITVNAILMTILLPLLSSNFIEVNRYMIPIVTFIITISATMILATVATRPALKSKVKNSELMEGDKSIFYFRNFKNMDMDEFVHTMRALLLKDQVFDKVVFSELYEVGTDLNRKHDWLIWCYWTFAIGVFVTMIGILVCVYTDIPT